MNMKYGYQNFNPTCKNVWFLIYSWLFDLEKFVSKLATPTNLGKREVKPFINKSFSNCSTCNGSDGYCQIVDDDHLSSLKSGTELYLKNNLKFKIP